MQIHIRLGHWRVQDCKDNSPERTERARKVHIARLMIGVCSPASGLHIPSRSGKERDVALW